MAHNLKEPVLCSQIATKDGLEWLEYLAVLQVANETRWTAYQTLSSQGA